MMWLEHGGTRVAWLAAILVGLFLVYAILAGEAAGRVFNALEDGVVGAFGWFYVLAVTFFLGFVLWLGFSRHSGIKLGPDDSVPEFSRLAWFTMLFSAGMGIGLVFWGVAEPMAHYADPPLASARSGEAMQDALRFSFFHWGLHTWAIYIIVALGIGYFHFRQGLPLAPRSALYPLLGDRVHGWMGDAVDVLVVFATLFALATSLGLGALQINGGLTRTLGLPDSVAMQMAIVAGITLIATVSVVLGVSRGILRLSNFNMALAAALLLFVLFAGPTLFILESLVGGIGTYLWTLPQTSLLIGDVAGADPAKQADWTLFYWGWWISWAPFVGLFIARVSKGRTIREFIAGVLVVPVAFAFVWFSVFGGTALFIEHELGGSIAEAAGQDEAFALYAMLEWFPLDPYLSLGATLLVLTFFVTSIDSGSLITGMVASGGREHPGLVHRFVWSIAMGTLAAVLLVVGGLEALQSAAITIGLAIAVLMAFMCWGLVRGLRLESPADVRATQKSGHPGTVGAEEPDPRRPKAKAYKRK